MSELSECTREVMQLMSIVLLDMEKIGRGNNQAAQRARVGTIKLAKLTKRFRSLSVEGHDEIKSNRVLFKLPAERVIAERVIAERLRIEGKRQKKIDEKIAKRAVRESKREAKIELKLANKRKRIHQLSAALAKLQEGL